MQEKPKIFLTSTEGESNKCNEILCLHKSKKSKKLLSSQIRLNRGT